MRRLRHLLPLACLLLIVATACGSRQVDPLESGLRSNLHAIRQLIEQYHGDHGRYPPTLIALVEAGYIRLVPFDPMTRRNDTWVETRQAGEGIASPGIVDVHSSASGTASDGTPYADW